MNARPRRLPFHAGSGILTKASGAGGGEHGALPSLWCPQKGWESPSGARLAWKHRDKVEQMSHAETVRRKKGAGRIVQKPKKAKTVFSQIAAEQHVVSGKWPDEGAIALFLNRWTEFKYVQSTGWYPLEESHNLIWHLYLLKFKIVLYLDLNKQSLK